MQGPTRSFLSFNLGALCCALVWGLSAAQPPQRTASAVTSVSDAPVMRPECTGWGGKSVARTELFFGLARSDGSPVTAEEFQSFVDREVTPRFPQGLTLLGGNGQFRDASGTTIRENSKLLILLYAYDRDSSRNIEAIRAAYVKSFAQEAVLRVDGTSCLS